MTPTDIPWNVVARDALANSRRWFPHLHDDDFGAIVHFTLGLAGEVGELVAAVRIAAPIDDVYLESADVVTYTMDIGAMLGLDLEAPAQRADIADVDDLDVIVMRAGSIANIVKKANRGDTPMTDLRAARMELEECCVTIIAYVTDLVYNLDGQNIIDWIATKVAICEERWG